MTWMHMHSHEQCPRLTRPHCQDWRTKISGDINSQTNLEYYNYPLLVLNQIDGVYLILFYCVVADRSFLSVCVHKEVLGCFVELNSSMEAPSAEKQE